MKKILFIFFTLILISNPLQAQKTSDEVVAEFFRIYQINTSDAIDYAFQNNKWMEERGEEILNLKYQLFETQKLMGEYLGFEKLHEQNLGQSLKELTYVVKYERQPLRFKFHFYKARNDWEILNFYYDDNFSEEFLKLD
jgi:hypothetical protein